MDDKLYIFNAYDKLIALHKNEGNFIEASKATYANLKVCEALGDENILSDAQASVKPLCFTRSPGSRPAAYCSELTSVPRQVRDQEVTQLCSIIALQPAIRNSPVNKTTPSDSFSLLSSLAVIIYLKEMLY